MHRRQRAVFQVKRCILKALYSLSNRSYVICMACAQQLNKTQILKPLLLNRKHKSQVQCELCKVCEIKVQNRATV